MDNNLKEILFSLFENDFIKPNDIPNIELYMDQVTTFMDKHLSAQKRNSDDKIMTKTMINNYTKNHLLPPSTKKKYSKDHLFLLIMIYYCKSVLSISDIQSLLAPITNEYFPDNPDNGLSLEKIYETIMVQLDNSKGNSQEHIEKLMEESKHLFDFAKMSDEDKRDLSLFALICQLCYDIYIRKQMIERLIDKAYPKTDTKHKNKK